MMAHPMYDDDVLTGEMTRQVVKNYGDILQFHIGNSADVHIDWLLSVFDIPENATVCDVGCGVGGVAWRMAEKRPDIKWILLNRSQEQLDMCPDIGEKICSDMHTLPEDIDVVMINYALGHADIKLFAEACAATKATSVVIYEPMQTGLLPLHDLEEQLQYTFNPMGHILSPFEMEGFPIKAWAKSPHTKSSSAEAYGIDLSGIRSMALRLARSKETNNV